MQKISVEALARQQLAAAGRASSGRAADTVVGGHEKVLRQTVVGLVAGTWLGERTNHDETTVYVLTGRVRLRRGDVCWYGRTGDLLLVPPDRHSLEAVEDSTLLITVAKLDDRGGRRAGARQPDAVGAPRVAVAATARTAP